MAKCLGIFLLCLGLGVTCGKAPNKSEAYIYIPSQRPYNAALELRWDSGSMPVEVGDCIKVTDQMDLETLKLVWRDYYEGEVFGPKLIYGEAVECT